MCTSSYKKIKVKMSPVQKLASIYSKPEASVNRISLRRTAPSRIMKQITLRNENGLSLNSMSFFASKHLRNMKSSAEGFIE